MSEVDEKSGTTNKPTFVSGSGATVNIQNSTINLVAGGNVNNPVQPAAATTNQGSELQTQIRIDKLEKNLNGNTKTKSRLKITGKFRTLREPTSQFSPQMTKTKNYFGGERCGGNMDEFKSSKQTTKGEPITYEQFLQEIIEGESKRIALVGGAGFGKTTELKKLAQILLKNKDLKQDLHSQEHFRMIHWIDLKSLEDAETTLQELLFDDLDLNESDMEYLLNWIKENQSKVIFLFDGLDQTRFQTSESHDMIRGLKKKRSAESLVHNILSGYFFPEVKIVTTSREHRVTTLPEEARPDLVIALTGFTQKNAEKLFSEVSSGIEDETMENIRELDIIKIPVYTIFAAVVHEFYKKDIPKYVSGLLTKILKVFTKSTQMRKINVKNIENLHKLMAMAFEGMKSRRMTFSIEDLKKHGLNKVDVSDMMSKVPKEDVHLGLLVEGDIVLMFCHQTLQEFLAACYISKMEFDDFKSFTYDFIKVDEQLNHWSVVVQYLAGITLNSEVEFDECIHKFTDKNRKQEILRNALQGRDADVAECLVLHESNDDSLIRQLERIDIDPGTPLNSNSARAISSLMRRNETMNGIWLQSCGITDELLRILAENMKSSLLQNVRILKAWGIVVTNERHRVLFKNGDKFLGEFNKDEKLLKLVINGGRLYEAVRLQNTCVADKIQSTAKERCRSDLKYLHAMLDPKWEVDGKDMDLEVDIFVSELDALVTGSSDVREAATRWSVRSLKVKLFVKSQEFLQKFKDRIGASKIQYLRLWTLESYVFCDDDFKITSSLVAQCKVEHLELRTDNPKSEHLKSILRNGKLKILECSSSFPIDEFNEIQETARFSDTKLLGIVLSQSNQVTEEDSNSEEDSEKRQLTAPSDEDSNTNGEMRSKRSINLDQSSEVGNEVVHDDSRINTKNQRKNCCAIL